MANNLSHQNKNNEIPDANAEWNSHLIFTEFMDEQSRTLLFQNKAFQLPFVCALHIYNPISRMKTSDTMQYFCAFTFNNFFKLCNLLYLNF